MTLNSPIKPFLYVYFLTVFVLSPIYFYWLDKTHLETLLKSILLNFSGYVLVFFVFRKYRSNAVILSILPILHFIWAFLLFLLVIVLLSIDLDQLTINREFKRESNNLYKLLNLHILLFFVSCIIYFYYKAKTFLNSFFVIIPFFLSTSISLFEGRRAALIIPFLIFGFFWINKNKIKLSYLLFSLLILIAAFVGVTIVRTQTSLDQIGFVFTLVIDRVLNPGNMSLVIFENSISYEPDLVKQILSRIQYTFGLSSNYEPVGNSFGRHYGIIGNNNFIVAINPGVINELYLSVGYIPFLFSFWVISKSFFLLMKQFSKYIHGSDFFIALLFCHSLQMEVGYTVGLLIKLTALLVLTKFTYRVLKIYIKK